MTERWKLVQAIATTIEDFRIQQHEHLLGLGVLSHEQKYGNWGIPPEMLEGEADLQLDLLLAKKIVSQLEARGALKQ